MSKTFAIESVFLAIASFIFFLFGIFESSSQVAAIFGLIDDVFVWSMHLDVCGEPIVRDHSMRRWTIVLNTITLLTTNTPFQLCTAYWYLAIHFLWKLFILSTT